MNRSGLILRQEDAARAAKDVAEEVTTLAAHVFRVALTETLDAKEGERFSDALDRRIDERIAARRWWRFWA